MTVVARLGRFGVATTAAILEAARTRAEQALTQP